MTTAEESSLDVLANDFANRLTALTQGVLGKESPPFRAVESGHRVQVVPIAADGRTQRIPVRINDEAVLSRLQPALSEWRA